MKITIKTIKNEIFPIEILDENPTVLNLKQAILKEKGIEIECQNLIFKGILLTDGKNLKESKIDEGSNIVLMVKKNLNIAQAQQQPAQVQQQQQLIAAPPLSPIQSQSQPIVQQQSQQQQHPQEKIDQLMSMGFMKSDVIGALDAANGDQVIATEYLLGGMEGYDDQQEQNMQPQVGGAPQMNIAELLQSNPEMVQQFIQQNPQLAQQIGQNPQLLQNLISQMQNQGEDDDDEEDGQEGDDAMYYENAIPQQQNIDMSLNEQDEQAILRIMGLGFEREAVVQAYLACMKNEDYAANYLFDHQN